MQTYQVRVERLLKMLEIWIQCMRREALCEMARGRPSPQHPVAGGGACRVKMTCSQVWSNERDLINEGRHEICSDKECNLSFIFCR